MDNAACPSSNPNVTYRNGSTLTRRKSKTIGKFSDPYDHLQNEHTYTLEEFKLARGLRSSQ